MLTKIEIQEMFWSLLQEILRIAVEHRSPIEITAEMQVLIDECFTGSNKNRIQKSLNVTNLVLETSKDPLSGHSIRDLPSLFLHHALRSQKKYLKSGNVTNLTKVFMQLAIMTNDYASALKLIEKGFNKLKNLTLIPLMEGSIVAFILNVSKNKKMLELLLKNGLSDTKKFQNLPPILWALNNDEYELALVLARYGNNNTACDADGLQALHFAASSEMPDLVDILLERNVDINCRVGLGLTPLHVAVIHDQLEMVKLLHQRGARMNDLAGEQNCSPFTYSLMLNRTKIANYFLDSVIAEHEINITMQDFYFALCEKNNYAVRKIISYNLDFQSYALTEYGELELAAIDAAVLFNNQKNIKLLLERGAQLNTCNREYKVLTMHFAIMAEYFPNVELLLQHAKNTIKNEVAYANLIRYYLFSYPNKKGYKKLQSFFNNTFDKDIPIWSAANLFCWLVFHEKQDLLVELLSAESIADLDYGLKDISLSQGLILAIINKSYAMLEMLLEYGVNPDSSLLNNGEFPINVAIRQQSPKIIELLLKYTASPNCLPTQEQAPLLQAISLGNVEIIQLLLANGADANVCGNDGNSALALAINPDCQDKFKLVTDLCKLDLADSTDNDKNDIASLLIENGADVNAKNKFGISIFLQAIYMRDYSTINHILALPDFNVRDSLKSYKYAFYLILQTKDLQLIDLYLQNIEPKQFNQQKFPIDMFKLIYHFNNPALEKLVLDHLFANPSLFSDEHLLDILQYSKIDFIWLLIEKLSNEELVERFEWVKLFFNLNMKNGMVFNSSSKLAAIKQLIESRINLFSDFLHWKLCSIESVHELHLKAKLSPDLKQELDYYIATNSNIHFIVRDENNTSFLHMRIKNKLKLRSLGTELTRLFDYVTSSKQRLSRVSTEQDSKSQEKQAAKQRAAYIKKLQVMNSRIYADIQAKREQRISDAKYASRTKKKSRNRQVSAIIPVEVITSCAAKPSQSQIDLAHIDELLLILDRLYESSLENFIGSANRVHHDTYTRYNTIFLLNLLLKKMTLLEEPLSALNLITNGSELSLNILSQLNFTIDSQRYLTELRDMALELRNQLNNYKQFSLEQNTFIDLNKALLDLHNVVTDEFLDQQGIDLQITLVDRIRHLVYSMHELGKDLYTTELNREIVIPNLITPISGIVWSMDILLARLSSSTKNKITFITELNSAIEVVKSGNYLDETTLVSLLEYSYKKYLELSEIKVHLELRKQGIICQLNDFSTSVDVDEADCDVIAIVSEALNSTSLQ